MAPQYENKNTLWEQVNKTDCKKVSSHQHNHNNAPSKSRKTLFFPMCHMYQHFRKSSNFTNFCTCNAKLKKYKLFFSNYYLSNQLLMQYVITLKTTYDIPLKTKNKKTFNRWTQRDTFQSFPALTAVELQPTSISYSKHPKRQYSTSDMHSESGLNMDVHSYREQSKCLMRYVYRCQRITKTSRQLIAMETISRGLYNHKTLLTAICDQNGWNWQKAHNSLLCVSTCMVCSHHL